MKTSVNQGANYLTTIFWAILAACFADIFLVAVTVKTYRLIRDYNLDHGHSVVGSTHSVGTVRSHFCRCFQLPRRS